MSRLSHRYSVYGVEVTSDWPMAFPPSTGCGTTLAEVDFVEGTDEDFSDPVTLRSRPEPWFTSHVFPDRSSYARWSGLYEFRIDADGCRVACRALDGCDPIVLQNYLFGQALSFALVQQGLEPLHAAAVRVDDVAIGFLGDCTFGKSTLMASFLQAGYRALTDDLLMLVAKDGRTVALPGSGRIKLQPDSAGAFIETTIEGEPLNAATLKRSFPLAAAQVQRTELALTHLFVLPTPEERKHITSIGITPLSRTAMFQELLKGSFNVQVLTRERLKRQFAWAAGRSATLDCFLLQYPDGIHHLPLVRQCIVDHVRRTAIAQRRHIQ
jgi:hypothetical protein